MILLSDEEIKGVKELAKNPPIKDGMLTLHIYDTERAVAKEQLKAVVEWGEGKCDNGTHKAYSDRDKRKYCPNCLSEFWRALQKEIES